MVLLEGDVDHVEQDPKATHADDGVAALSFGARIDEPQEWIEKRLGSLLE